MAVAAEDEDPRDVKVLHAMKSEELSLFDLFSRNCIAAAMVES